MNVTLWRQLGENATESLQRGMRVIVTGRLEQRLYETSEGDKRMVFEVDADDIGPSLRNATAKVAKAARSTGGRPRIRPTRPTRPTGPLPPPPAGRTAATRGPPVPRPTARRSSDYAGSRRPLRGCPSHGSAQAVGAGRGGVMEVRPAVCP